LHKERIKFFVGFIGFLASIIGIFAFITGQQSISAILDNPSEIVTNPKDVEPFGENQPTSSFVPNLDDLLPNLNPLSIELIDDESIVYFLRETSFSLDAHALASEMNSLEYANSLVENTDRLYGFRQRYSINCSPSMTNTPLSAVIEYSIHKDSENTREYYEINYELVSEWERFVSRNQSSSENVFTGDLYRIGEDGYFVNSIIKNESQLCNYEMITKVKTVFLRSNVVVSILLYFSPLEGRIWVNNRLLYNDDAVQKMRNLRDQASLIAERIDLRVQQNMK